MDYESMILRENEMANNKATRALICLCIDSSYSMRGERIDTVNAEIDKFLQEMYNNKTARDAVEICLVSFGDEIEVKCKFGPLKEAIDANKSIKAVGSRTSMGAGIKKVLELLDQEINDLDAGGNKYYKPWLIIISDGEATDGRLCEEISKDVLKRQREHSLKVKCLSMGDDNELTSLRMFSLDSEVEKINAIEAMEFFSMLSRSVSAASQSAIQSGEF